MREVEVERERRESEGERARESARAREPRGVGTRAGPDRGYWGWLADAGLRLGDGHPPPHPRHPRHTPRRRRRLLSRPGVRPARSIAISESHIRVAYPSRTSESHFRVAFPSLSPCCPVPVPAPPPPCLRCGARLKRLGAADAAGAVQPRRRDGALRRRALGPPRAGPGEGERGWMVSWRGGKCWRRRVET